MAKKFLVRIGFVVNLELRNAQSGETYVRTFQGGEEVTLEDDQVKAHAHKLEFALQKDRDAALAAEREARTTAQAANSPAELVKSLIDALSQIQQQSAPAATPAGA